MCTFMSTAELPSNTKSGGVGAKKQFISYFMKPNNGNEMLRCRLLWYKQSAKNNRNSAYIWQMVHDHWGTTEKGVKIVDDTVICPSTKPQYSSYDEDRYILNPKKGKKEVNCPICSKASEAFGIWKASGFKDKAAMQRYNSLKVKFRGCFPIYIINDPNNEKNNDTMKVLILTDRKEFDALDELIQREKTNAYLSAQKGTPYEVFNGNNAVDLYLQMKVVTEIRNEGKPTQYTANVRKITGMKFGSKAYTIDKITKDKIDLFQFDDQFYFSNTKGELKEFYNKYYGSTELHAPEEEIDFGDSSSNVVKNEVVKETVTTQNDAAIINNTENNDNLTDINGLFAEAPPVDITEIHSDTEDDTSTDAPSAENDEAEMKNLLTELGID